MRAGADPYFLGDFAFEHLSHTLDRRIWLGPSFQLTGVFGSREISSFMCYNGEVKASRTWPAGRIRFRRPDSVGNGTTGGPTAETREPQRIQRKRSSTS